MKPIVFGAGNVGTTLINRLKELGLPPLYIIRTSGIYDGGMNKIAEQSDWKKYVEKGDVAFICTPSTGKGEQTLAYSLYFLDKNKKVITCEKASVAYHWDILKKYKDLFKYNASVGGGTKMLKEISKYRSEDIYEIKAVVNGTLNYISDGIKKEKTKESLLKEVLDKGFAEPGSNSFEEVIETEINDVILKTVILANHSHLYSKTVKPEDISFQKFSDKERCVVHIKKDSISAGFTEDNLSKWLPEGVNNVLYINNERKAVGPGAGADATVDTMIEDLK